VQGDPHKARCLAMSPAWWPVHRTQDCRAGWDRAIARRALPQGHWGGPQACHQPM